MRMVSPRATAHVAVLAALGLGLAACSSSSSASEVPVPTQAGTTAPPPTAGLPYVTEKDFAISLNASSAPAGSVTFTIANEGPSVHEFVVFKTDLAADQLPTGADGDVDETGAGVKHIDEVENIASGTSDSLLTVDLKPGAYVVLCNLPGHYGLGMAASFTVEA